MTFNEHIATQPSWIQIWLLILSVTNLAAVIFAFFDRRAHWVLTAMLAVMIVMPEMFDRFGYTRILGLTHVIFWTPLVIYLWRARQPDDLKTWVGRYLYLVIIVNGISLIIDYIDVARFLLGDTGTVNPAAGG